MGKRLLGSHPYSSDAINGPSDCLRTVVRRCSPTLARTIRSEFLDWMLNPVRRTRVFWHRREERSYDVGGAGHPFMLSTDTTMSGFPFDSQSVTSLRSAMILFTSVSDLFGIVPSGKLFITGCGWNSVSVDSQ